MTLTDRIIMCRLQIIDLTACLALAPLPLVDTTLSEMESDLDLRPTDRMQSTFAGKEVRLPAWQQMENVKAGKGWGIVRKANRGKGSKPCETRNVSPSDGTRL